MPSLEQLLRFLSRDDVSEVVLQTGKPPSAKLGSEYRLLDREPLTEPTLTALIRGTEVEMLIPEQDVVGAQLLADVGGRSYAVRIARRGAMIQIRFARSARPAARSRPDLGPPQSPREEAIEPPSARAPAPSVVEDDGIVFEIQPDDGPSPRVPSPSPSRVPATPPSPVRAPATPPSPARAPAPAPSPAARAFPAESPSARATTTVEPTGGTQTLERLLSLARSRNASDLLIVSDRPPLLRVAGELSPVGGALRASEVESLLTGPLNDAQKSSLATRGYVDLALDLTVAGRARVNIARQKGGLKGTFRLVLSPVPTLESLGLPRELARVTTYHQGLVVLAGPSGQGKTTTLAAIVDLINSTRPHHVLTVEDPIEFLHPRKKAVISQREVGAHTRSFATALKASLREDPDVIVIGELRDRETVEIAITAAETGHLVISTMSTPSAGKTIDRLIDLFPPEDQSQVRTTLAGALKFVLAQRLLPTVDGAGFVPAVELLTGVPALWALIRRNELFQLPSLQQRGRAFGMIRFDDSVLELLRAGKISEETALRFSESKKEMQAALRPGVAPEPSPQPVPVGQGGGAQKLTDLASRMGKGLFGKREG